MQRVQPTPTKLLQAAGSYRLAGSASPQNLPQTYSLVSDSCNSQQLPRAVCIPASSSAAAEAVPATHVSAFPRLAQEWHPTRNGGARPEDVRAGSRRKAWWLCTGCRFCGERHEWEAIIANRALNNTGCPQCNSRGAGRVCACSSVASHPILGPEFDGEENHPLRAANLSLASNRTVIWRCAADPSHPPFKARIKQRSGANATGCPQCFRELPRLGKWHDSLAAECPGVAEEWDRDQNKGTAWEVKAGSSRRAMWRCTRCSHVWTAAVKDRALKGTGCPACYRGKRPASADT